jgi:zinc/manganese transport system permease protein
MFDLLTSDLFLRTFVGATLVAVLAAPVGYFLVLRAQVFAAEAFMDICFAGAAGAVLIGVAPLVGMALFSLLAAAGLGALGGRARGRAVEVGMVLSFALGLGVLFLNAGLRGGASRSVSGIGALFGSLMSVQWVDVRRMLVLSLLDLAALMVLFRPLLFATFDPVVARARRVPVSGLAVVFLIVLALAVTAVSLVTGALLAVVLLVAPAAAAVNLTRRPASAIAASVGLGLFVAWGGLALTFVGTWHHPPAGFSFTVLAAVVYGVSLLPSRRRQRRPPPTGHPDNETREERAGW